MAGWDGSEFTAAAGTRMHAAVFGPPGAPWLVCVHGLGCSHRYFLPLARALAPGLRVAAVDLPGFGRTPGPGTALDMRGLSIALAEWLRATRRQGAALVANSQGCQVVVDLAAHAPDLLGPTVLNGPTVDPAARTARQQAARLLRNARHERATLGVVLARDYLDCGPRRYVATLRHMLDDPVERKLRFVTVPTVVARGERDTIVPREWAQRVTALLPDGRYAEVPGAGHTLNYSAPAALARITRELLDRAGAGR